MGNQELRRAHQTVSVCIPTWNAEKFLARTIESAVSQCYDNLQIVISVDQSTDTTAKIAIDWSKRDSRIEVLRHENRLGWTHNTNAALDAARGEYYFLYFHDDLISPDYVTKLKSYLDERPEAGSVYCNVAQGLAPSSHITSGHSYNGNTTEERMMSRLLSSAPGSPMRALTRRAAFNAPPRMPRTSLRGFHAQHAYLFNLIAQAPCLNYPETLYRRDHMREGGLVRSWSKLDLATIVGDLQQVVLSIFKRIGSAPICTRAALRYAAMRNIQLLLRQAEFARGVASPLPLDKLIPGFQSEMRDSMSFPDHWRTDLKRVETEVDRIEKSCQPS